MSATTREIKTMAFGKTSGFAAFAAREHQLVEVIATTPAPPPPPTAHELRAQRKAAKRAKRELAQATPEQFDFSQLLAASPASNSASDLEREMRAALGLDSAAEAPKPEPVQPIVIDFVPVSFAITPNAEQCEQARETRALLQKLEGETREALGIASKEKDAPKPKPRAPREYVKRQFEIILGVRNSMGLVVPFYHLDDNPSRVQAEINACKKARSFGCVVIETRSVEIRETIFKADSDGRVSTRRESFQPIHA